MGNYLHYYKAFHCSLKITFPGFIKFWKERLSHKFTTIVVIIAIAIVVIVINVIVIMAIIVIAIIVVIIFVIIVVIFFIIVIRF